MPFEAGSVVGRLGLDLSGYAQGMLQAGAIMRIFPANVQSFLASPLLGLIDLAKQAAGAIKDAFLEIGHAADNAGEAAERVGVSVEFLTGVGAVAADAGASVESLADSMKFLNNNAADAASGSDTARKAFADLGVDFTDASGKLRSGEEIFYAVADAIKALPDAASKTQAAMNLLGRGGTELIPTLNKGSASIKEFAGEIAALGGTIDGDLADAGDKFGTLETLVSAAWRGMKKTLAEPILNYVKTHFEEVKQTLKEWAEKVRSFIIDYVWPAMKTLGNVAQWVAENFRTLAIAVGGLIALKATVSVVDLLAGAFKALVPQLAAATAAQNAFNAAKNGLGSVVAGTATGSLVGGGGGGATVGGGIGSVLGGIIGGLLTKSPGGVAIGAQLGGAAGGWIGGKFDDATRAAPPANVEVNVNTQQGASPEQIAEQVKRGVQEELTRQQRSGRSRYDQGFIQGGL